MAIITFMLLPAIPFYCSKNQKLTHRMVALVSIALNCGLPLNLGY